MRSPFGPIRRAISQALELATRLVVAVETIVGTLAALLSTISRFEFRESTHAEPAHDIRMEGLAQRIDDLTVAVDEGIKNVQRSERRVRAIVTSARRSLADAGYEHPGLEAENGELREIDGERSNDEPVPAVPEDLATPTHAGHSVIPGVSVRQMQIARARRR